MRKITVSQIFAFMSQLTFSLLLSVATTWWLVGSLPLGDFRGVVLTLTGVVLLYVYAILAYRLFLKMFPLEPGEIAAGSRQEFIYHVYVLFYLLLFYPVIRSGFVPAPIMRMFYLALGTRLGENTYSQGIIHDPPFVEIGRDSVVGQSALIIPHVIEGNRLGHYPIRMGNNVTIGAGAIVLSDVEMGDNAIVAAGAVVSKGSRIAAGETWGGVPARCISRKHAADT